MALNFTILPPEEAEAIKSAPAPSRNAAAQAERQEQYDNLIGALKESNGGVFNVTINPDPESDETKRKITNRLNRAATRHETVISYKLSADGLSLAVWIDERPGTVETVVDPETGEEKTVPLPVRERRRKAPKATEGDAAPAEDAA